MSLVLLGKEEVCSARTTQSYSEPAFGAVNGTLRVIVAVKIEFAVQVEDVQANIRAIVAVGHARLHAVKAPETLVRTGTAKGSRDPCPDGYCPQ